MQSLPDVYWAIWISVGVASIALIMAIAALIDSRMKERTRKKERRIDALAVCHTLLEEAIKMHPSLDTDTAFIFRDELADEINRRADTLFRLSWVCKGLGEDIRKGVSILKSMAQVEYTTADECLSNEERRELLEKIRNLRDKLAIHLNE